MYVLSWRTAGNVIGKSLMQCVISIECALGNIIRRGVRRGVFLSLNFSMATGDMTLTWLPSSNKAGMVQSL